MRKRQLRSLKLNKKGDLTDLALYMVISVFLAISLIVVLFVNNVIKTDVIEGTVLGNTTAATSILESFGTVNDYTTQNAYAMMMGLLLISVVVSAFLVRIHPAFIIVYLIVVAFVIFVAVFIGNMYEDVMQNDKLKEIAEKLPKINFFMENIVMITLIAGALSMLIAFSKVFQDGGGVSDI